MFHSQYLASLPLFNPYVHTIRSLCIIKPTKVHLSTIYSISQGAFSLKKIVNFGVIIKVKKTCSRLKQKVSCHMLETFLKHP